MKNFLRTRTSMSAESKHLRKNDCDHYVNSLNVNCEENEPRADNVNPEWCSHTHSNEKVSTNSNATNETGHAQAKQKPGLLNAACSRLSPHLNTLLPQFYAGEKRRSYGETFYKSLAVNKRPRLVKKCGELNIHMENVAKHKRRLFKDLFNTVIGKNIRCIMTRKRYE